MKKLSVLVILSITVLFFADCHPKLHPAETAKKTPSAAPAKTATPEHIAQGKMIYEAQCNKCHDLPKPGEYKVSDWADILPKMIIKSNMSKENGDLVKDYVVVNAKP
jgi:cytochrome c5